MPPDKVSGTCGTWPSTVLSGCVAAARPKGHPRGLEDGRVGYAGPATKTGMTRSVFFA
jgi:hypothetical protein